MLRNSFSNAHHESYLCFDSLFYTRCSDGWRHENCTGSCAGLLNGIRDASEDRLSEMRLASFLWIGAADNIRAILYRLLGMESTLSTREALEDDLGITVDAEVLSGRGISGRGLEGGVGGAGRGSGGEGLRKESSPQWLLEGLHGTTSSA